MHCVRMQQMREDCLADAGIQDQDPGMGECCEGEKSWCGAQSASLSVQLPHYCWFVSDQLMHWHDVQSMHSASGSTVVQYSIMTCCDIM